MLFRLVIGLGLALALLTGCSGDSGTNAYEAAPSQMEEVVLEAMGSRVEPLRIQLLGDTLYVATRNSEVIRLFDPETFRYLGDIALNTSPPVSPVDLAVTEDAVMVGDHSRGLVAFFNRQGDFREAFGVLPDEKTTLSPISLVEFGGVVYVADIKSRRVLAVSTVDAEGVTERGELILTIPMEGNPPLKLPSALMVTPDGRLLVGDAAEGLVFVFTCDGRPVYRFEDIPEERTPGPQAMAYDDMIDPSLQDPQSFDPSGVRQMGRVHVVDGMNGRIHMFNPLGRYVSSYPKENKRLAGPSDIAIDRVRNRIIVCDPPANRLVTFSYGGVS